MSNPTAQLPQPAQLGPLLEDLGLIPAHFEAADSEAAGQPSRCLLVDADAGDLAAQLEASLGERGAALLWVPGSPSEARMAEVRNRAWPHLHAVALYRGSSAKTKRQSLSGGAELAGWEAPDGAVLAMRRREHVLSPEATQEKFDKNASGWNGEPGGPGYPHFRWMRRYVGLYEKHPGAKRILDFGCGAGWVGIEAALKHPGAHLSFFDPSPEMVKISENNCREQGLSDFTGRVGFGERPPFPAEGEAPYDLVISSGVVSFSPDFEAWMQGLHNSCAPGATLVVGDINPNSAGMQKRRRERPLVPVRELNGVTPDRVRAWLEQKGYRHTRSSSYQLSFPMPQLMYVNETKLGGLLSHPLVWSNALATRVDGLLGRSLAGRFDSWVMGFKAPA
ncbi:MAG: class I SAM-dependent methyltransferase [Planctomycetota bacterium]